MNNRDYNPSSANDSNLTRPELDPCLLPGSVDPTHVFYNPECISTKDYEDWLNDYIEPTAIEWWFVGLISLTFVVGVTGNLLVSLVVLRTPSMQSPTNFFLLNLAIADLFILLIVLPITILWDITETWFLGGVPCKLILYCQNLSVSVSILTLVAISIERWYAICRPLFLRSTLRRTIGIIVMIWLVGMAIASPELVLLDSVPYKKFMKRNFSTTLMTSCVDVVLDKPQQFVYQILQSIFLYLMPLVFIGVLYGSMIKTVQRSTVAFKCPSQNKTSETVLLTSPNRTNAYSSTQFVDNQQGMTSAGPECRQKATRMMIIVVFVFAISFFPTHLLNILQHFHVLVAMDPFWHSLMLLSSRLLCYLNSTVNPIIYNFMSERFRIEFAKVFHSRCCT